MNMSGKGCWYIVDGYRPPVKKGGTKTYVGHECYMILNCNEQDNHALIDILFKDKDPILGIEYVVAAKRLPPFYNNQKEILDGVSLDITEEYSIRFRSDVGIFVQNGRVDVNQSNLAYLATIGFLE